MSAHDDAQASRHEPHPGTLPVPDLALFRRLLDLHEDATPYEVVTAAGRVSQAYRALVMTAAAREGVVGSGSADELRRRAERTAFYARVQDRCAALGARPLKGLSLAAWYPDDLPRPMNDLDLVVPDTATLWRVVGALVAEYAPQEMDLAVLDGEARHLAVALSWPGADPLLDYETRVEILTCALTGDEGAVPRRPVLPEDPLAAALLAVAEERFQRPFNGKDVVDVMMALAPGRPLDLPLLARAADAYHLAPELAELLELYAGAVQVPGPGSARDPGRLPSGFHPLLATLGEASVRELRRREDWRGERGTATAPGAGALRHGMRLTPLESVPRPHRRAEAAGLHPFDGGSLLLTPVADFLLVTGAVVDPALYDAAKSALAEVSPAVRGS
ncbi:MULTISPECIES: hypothetical protein [unclassified Streptomyces]|uniref:hypothetical protein n=1 Tax=unclassified Streptomyces TaxID=2593676 RepID=UPI00093E0C7B|nr:hypothetical protein [Streptomyces sp. CB01883]